jgi:hypothetical protein
MNVSLKLPASFFRVEETFRNVDTTYQNIKYHYQEASSLDSHRHGNLKSHK